MSLTDLTKLVATLSVAGSFVYACIRVGLVAGRTDGRLSNLSEGLRRVTESLERFVEKADGRLDEHGQRLARVETHLGLVDRRNPGMQ